MAYKAHFCFVQDMGLKTGVVVVSDRPLQQRYARNFEHAARIAREIEAEWNRSRRKTEERDLNRDLMNWLHQVADTMTRRLRAMG